MKNKKVTRLSAETKSRIMKLADSAISAACVFFALRTLPVVSNADPGVMSVHFFVTYILLAASKVILALYARKSDKAAFIRNIVFAVVFAAAGTASIVFGLNGAVPVILIASFYAAIIVNRVFSIIRDHRVRSVIFNVIGAALAMIFFVSIFTSTAEEFAAYLLLHCLIVAGAAICHIIKLSFSQMRLSVLQKIIRKTYTAEILFGLLLLIVSFSFVFVTLEPGFNTYVDAVWYCFSVVTTIGFGDFTVASLVSRALTVILGVYGIVVVAVITSVVVNFYNEVKDSDQKDRDPLPAPEAREDEPGDPAGAGEE